MKYIALFISGIVVISTIAFSQTRSYEIHRRGMLHQTVYNTGELGRAYDDGSTGSRKGVPSFEWPANSARSVDATPYNGHYNSYGAGIYVLGYIRDTCHVDQCGAVSDVNGNAYPVVGYFSNPISIERKENYPLLSNGDLNPVYNPDEAEEIIISKWLAIDTKIEITRTSRAWSYPDYDDFIIYEYELKNTSSLDTLEDVIVAWAYAFCTSMFGYERKYNRWSETDTRSKDQYARYDLKRYMSYNHDRAGMPDETYFAAWSPTARYGGGLNAPAAAGIISLFYEYDVLAQRAYGPPELFTNAFFDIDKYREVFEDSPWPAPNDGRGRMKQPYINRYENGNLYPSKVGKNGFIDCRVMRKTSPFGSSAGTYPSIGSYWIGRTSPSWTIGNRQPGGHIYGFGPYYILPDSSIRFAIAEVAGFGPGVAGDTIYTDIGGGYGSDFSEESPGTHPVPSWYKEISYPEAKSLGNPTTIMGSNYLQNYPMPAFVNSNVVSIRDVADRAIQMYTGWPLIKYDSVNNNGCGFEPKNAPRTGMYQVPIPVPSPAIIVENTDKAKNIITWNNNVESFSTPRLSAPLSHYRILRASHHLGPWSLVDSVGIQDARYYDAMTSTYIVEDPNSFLGQSFYYSVISIDSLGGKSGRTNITLHETQLPAKDPMTKVYVVPNPLVISSVIPGEEDVGEGNIHDRIQFYGLPRRATIRIFSYSGQLVNTIEHDRNSLSANWYQVSRNNQRIASGVYFFTVDDHGSGKRAFGKFVVIH